MTETLRMNGNVCSITVRISTRELTYNAYPRDERGFVHLKNARIRTDSSPTYRWTQSDKVY